MSQPEQPESGAAVPAAIRDRSAILDTADRLGAPLRDVELLLDRVDSELPTYTDGGETAPMPLKITWPTRQDALAWVLAGVCSDDPTRNLSRLRDTPDLPTCVRRIAAADYVLSRDAPLVQRFELARHLRGMARFLESHRFELRGPRLHVSRGEVRFIPTPEYTAFPWGWPRVSGGGWWKRTSFFAESKLGPAEWRYDVPPLDEQEPVAPGRLGPWGLQMLGRLPGYQRLPWARIWPAFARAPEGDEEDNFPWSWRLNEVGTQVRAWSADDEALFRFRVDLLLDLSSLVTTQGSPEELWSSARSKLDRAFLREHVEDRIRELELEVVCEQPKALPLFDEIAFHIGPLAGMLEVTGHAELELELAVFDRVARMLPANHRDGADPFAVADSRVEDPLARAVREFLDAESKVELFWERFRTRLIRDLGVDFFTAVPRPTVLVRGRDVEKFLRLDETAARRIADDLEFERKSKESRYVFAKRNGGWWIQFGGEGKQFPERKGFHYIHYLIRNGPVLLTATQIRAAVSGQPTVPSTGSMSKSQARQQALSQRRDPGGIRDRAGSSERVEQILKAKRDLVARLDDTRDPPSPVERDQIHDEIDRLGVELSALAKAAAAPPAPDPPPRKAKETATSHRDNQAVRSDIKLAVGLLAKELPDLVDHLGPSFGPRGSLSYDPPRRPAWVFELPTTETDLIPKP